MLAGGDAPPELFPGAHQAGAVGATDQDARRHGRHVLTEALPEAGMLEELEEQAAFLRSEGCNHVQGFLFGKPLAAIEFEHRFIDGPTDDDSRRNIIPLPRRNGVPA